MKKMTLICLACVLSMTFFGCQLFQTAKTDDFYYGPEIGERIPGSFMISGRLDGMGGDLALLNDNDNENADSVDAPFAGLFSERDLATVFQKKASERIYPASMTKLMTFLLVVENVENLQETVTVTEAAFEALTPDASLAHIQLGEAYTYADLLYGLMLPSGNDAGNQLAYEVGGSIPAFIEKMNHRALELGMVNTHFMNAHGLHDAKHYTTIYDLYLLMRECLKHDLFVQIIKTDTHNAVCYNADGTTKTRKMDATNAFIRNYVQAPSGVTVLGGKTGYTLEAGRCLALACEGKNGLYIAIVAKAANYDKLYAEMINLLTKIPEYEDGRQ